ncbi:MAG: 16S rRNA (cytosine(1402)-N(4))-methyltransferase RsmH [Chloroflexota bacterium]|nr:16S rRNA (cytosine(1402)-N(4))-methyltransferase RsmH [Chloroflexota bacterium]
MSVHEPVLLAEAIQALAIIPAGHYVDCTLGRGGHARAMLERGADVLGIDADPEAVAGMHSSIRAVRANFDQLERVVTEIHFDPLQGVLFDLGLSSPQLEEASRGFSFRLEGPLDMRFDLAQPETAERLVNTRSADELSRIFRDYGEEPQARKMARAVERSRREAPIRTTTQLAQLIEQAAGGRGKIHPATRIFQALRIAVNRELERLESALPQAVKLLARGGRLVVISFHSLEDRLVKRFILRETRDCVCPPRTPVCVCAHRATLKAINRRPILPGAEELAHNPRARSAKMRVAERI